MAKKKKSHNSNSCKNKSCNDNMNNCNSCNNDANCKGMDESNLRNNQ